MLLSVSSLGQHYGCADEIGWRTGSRSDVDELSVVAYSHIAEEFVLLLRLFIYLFIEDPVNRTGSPQGFFTNSNLTEYIQYKTCTFFKRKTYKHNPKVSPFAIALVKKNGKEREEMLVPLTVTV